MPTVTTVFTTINGMLVHEDRGGVETEYVSDPLGSLVQTRNSSGTKTYDAQYWPYGELQTSTGTNLSSWGFVGLLGYLVDSATMLYVRARHLMTKFARWLTVDPMSPEFTRPYTYANDRPIDLTDPLGKYTEAECNAIFTTWLAKCGNRVTGCLAACGIPLGIIALCCALFFCPDPITKLAFALCLIGCLLVGGACVWACVNLGDRCLNEALAWYLRCLKKAKK